MIIGRGPLPDPDAVPEDTIGWIVPAAAEGDSAAFYGRYLHDGEWVWLRQDWRLTLYVPPTSPVTPTTPGSESDTLDSVVTRGGTTARDIEITDATRGLVLATPDGSRKRLTVRDDGAVTTTTL